MTPIHHTCDPVIHGWEVYGNSMCRLVEDMPRAGRAVEPNERLHALVFKDGPLTPEEQSELDAIERNAEQ